VPSPPAPPPPRGKGACGVPSLCSAFGRGGSRAANSEEGDAHEAPLPHRGGGAGGEGGALFDPTHTYRYRLWRVWNDALPRVAFVLLNPSTADADRDDPTIRRCVGFARAWGFGGVEVVNLFAYRATHPADLRRCAAADGGDPVGPENDAHLAAVFSAAGLVVAGWGVHGSLLGRAAAVRAAGLLPASAVCLGCTKSGEPRHPLYVRADQAPTRFFAGGEGATRPVSKSAFQR
jgi:hypothetical protein